MDELNPALSTVAEAARSTVVAFRTERDVIEVTGADAAGYLQGQLSQQIEQLDTGESRWTLLLQPQGKIDSWLVVHRLAADRFVLLVDRGFGAAALARLERFKLRVDAELSTATRPVLALRGPGSRALAERILVLDAGIANDAVAVTVDWNGPGVDVVRLGRDGWETASLPDEVLVGDERALDMVRVARGVPAMGSELDESTIPAAAGVVDSSVDFTKGCYVGQELVARVDSRGNNTPTFLVRLDISAPATAVSIGSELTEIGAEATPRPIGTVTSVAAAPGAADRSIGLAFVRRGTEVPGTAAVATLDGPPATVTLRPQSD